MPRMYIMSGIPGSGKTVYSMQNFPRAERVCRDDARIDGSGKYRFDLSKEPSIRYLAILKAKLAVDEGGRDLVIDETNLTAEKREAWAVLGRTKGYSPLVVLMDTSFQTCLARNDAREASRRVPEDTMRDMRDQFLATGDPQSVLFSRVVSGARSMRTPKLENKAVGGL